MNRLCREFEAIDFDIQFNKDESGHKKKQVSLLPTFENYFKDAFDQNKYDIVKRMYQDYTGRKQIKYLSAILQYPSVEAGGSSYSELRSSVYDMLIQDLQTRLPANNISGEEFLFYCNRVSSEFCNFNWAFAWDILDDQVITLIPQGKSFCPMLDPDGTEYLGRRYSLKDITQTGDVAIQKLIEAIFGHPDEIPDEELLNEIQAEAKEEEEDQDE